MILAIVWAYGFSNNIAIIYIIGKPNYFAELGDALWSLRGPSWELYKINNHL